MILSPLLLCLGLKQFDLPDGLKQLQSLRQRKAAQTAGGIVFCWDSFYGVSRNP